MSAYNYVRPHLGQLKVKTLDYRAFTESRRLLSVKQSESLPGEGMSTYFGALVNSDRSWYLYPLPRFNSVPERPTLPGITESKLRSKALKIKDLAHCELSAIDPCVTGPKYLSIRMDLGHQRLKTSLNKISLSEH